MQRRILVYLIAALVPMTVLALYLAVDERNEEEARARSEEMAVVNTARTDLDGLVQLTRGLVSALSYQETDSQVCQSLFPLKRSFPDLFNLAVLEARNGDDKARTICAAVPPADYSFILTPEETRLISTMRQPGDIAVGSIRRNLVDGRPVIPISSLASVAPDGTRRVVAVSVGLDALSRQVSLVPIPGQASLLVLDRNGVIAAQSPPSPQWPVGRPAPDFERSLAARGDFVGEISGEDGVSRFYAVSHVSGGGGMIVVLKIRASDIFHRSRVRLAEHLIGLLAISALVFGIAWTNSDRYIARPLARLAEAADRLARGHLSERSGLEHTGEIGRLAHSFDLMAEFLQQDEIRGAQMLEALRALTARLDSVGEEERTRIAREIHDELGQQLTAMRFELARLDQSITESSGGRAAAAQVQDLAAMVDVAIQDVRKIATALRPVALDYGGLADAIRFLTEEFERRTGIRCILHIPEPVDASGNLANCLFRICQESLTNIARHAVATAVEIRLASDPGCLTLTVRDNGRGFVPEAAAQTASLGLLGMRERARMAGGILSIVSAPGEGTTILAWIPVGGGAQTGDALAAFV